MTMPTAAEVWRLYNTDGVPASGAHAPEKLQVQAWAASLEGEVSDAMSDAAAALVAAAAVAPIPNGMLLAAMPKTAAVTLTLASPGVVNWTAHDLPAYTPLYLTTTGALPTGLTSGATVYITAGASLLTNSFRVSSSVANAIAGISINFTGSQSGTHTAFANYTIPYPYKGHRLTSVIEIADNIGLVDGVDRLWNSLVLPAGNWRCSCQAGVFRNAPSNPAINHMHNDFGIGISNIQTSPNNGGTLALHIDSNNPNGWIFSSQSLVFNLPSGGTLNAVMQTNFTGGVGALLAYGTILAELF